MTKKKRQSAGQRQAPQPVYPFGLQRRRRKSDWAGLSLGDAFKPALDYYLRISAQRLFYKTTRKAQIAAAKLALASTTITPEPMIKPQLAPCYTTYPSRLSAYASIGLTAYLEFEAYTAEKILLAHLEPYLNDATLFDGVAVEPHLYRKMGETIARIVQTRILLEDLSRSSSMAFVELYRLFAASQQVMKFRSVPEILNAVILYGDILPDWNERELHPFTRALLRTITVVSYPYLEQLPGTESHRLILIGADWVRSLNLALSRYLPLPHQTGKKELPPKGEPLKPKGLPVKPKPRAIFRWIEGKLNASPDEKEDFRFTNDPAQAEEPNEIAPLNRPNPPLLFEPEAITDQILESLTSPRASEGRGRFALQDPLAIASNVQTVLDRFSNALRMAGEQINEWEDMRSDRVEQFLREAAFAPGPMEGNPVAGHEVEIRSRELNAGGEIFDRAIELSENVRAAEILLNESQPIADELRRVLYPSIEQLPEAELLRTSGSIDPSRLALIEVSSAVFQRYRIQPRVDRRGRPVLLIACDGSGSLDQAQMKMAKLLVTAWLTSTARTQVQLLAGLYHSGEVRAGLAGPLVQWMYHPAKTTSASRREAVSALASLPATGTGVQSDALSIAFMLEEARRIARNKMIYMILITDCQWNCSFPAQGECGYDEVCAVLEQAYEDLQGRLHITLVALGVAEQTGLDYLLDKVISIPDEDLSDPAAVANQIGLYVASCIQERKRNHVS